MGLKFTQKTKLVCPFNVFSQTPLASPGLQSTNCHEQLGLTVSTTHMRTVLSSEAEARSSLSDDHAMSDSPSVWPFRVFRISPVYAFHSLINLSPASLKVGYELGQGPRYLADSPQEARIFPSGLNLIEDIDMVCPLSVL